MGVTVTMRGGSGDMLKLNYDPDLDGIIAHAQIGDLPSDKITSGILGFARIPTGLTQLEHTALGSVTMGSIAWFDGASVTLTTLAVDVLIVASISHWNNNAGTHNDFRINVDDSSYSQVYRDVPSAANVNGTVTIVHVATLTAAAHTIKVQGQPGATTGYMARSDIAVLELKK